MSISERAAPSRPAPQARHCPDCGCDLSKPGKARSPEQLRRYFALMKATFMHWPEAHPHQFANLEEMRSWLQMKAGHREVGAHIPISGMSKERALLLAEAAIRAANSFAWPVIHGDTLVVFRPKSISFAKLYHANFCRLASDVEAVILKETGLDPERLLLEKSA